MPWTNKQWPRNTIRTPNGVGCEFCGYKAGDHYGGADCLLCPPEFLPQQHAFLLKEGGGEPPTRKAFRTLPDGFLAPRTIRS